MTDEPLVLGGRYEVGPVIGRGGMADVRRAHDTRLGRDVAVKQLRRDLAGDSTFQERFRREAQAAAGLNHPTIVSVYDTGSRVDPETGVQIPYIVMELVEGSTLRDILREGRKILPERAFEIAAGVLDALAYSHKAGIIHRDIKPANVMLTRTGQVKVMDFGIARAVADTQATMTQTAAVIGTAQYLSPEQARGETVDARSDVYSAGCLLYELLTMRPPFVGDSPVSVAYQHVREVPQPPSQVGDGDPAITPAMDAVVLKSLAKSPADRYQSAGQMREDIERLLSGQPVAAVIPAAFLAAPTQALGDVDPTMQFGSPVRADDTAATGIGAVVGGAAGGAAGGALAAQNTATDLAEQPRKKRNGGMTALITVLILALLAGLGFLGYRIWQDSTRGKTVEVPSVIGYSEQVARSTLINAHLKPVVTYKDDPTATQEGVTEENPTPTTIVPINSEVSITVTRIPNKLTIPQVLGMTEKAARSTLVNAGFADANITTQDATDDTPQYAKGQVTAVTPGVGSPGNAGTQIVLTLATGQVTVPDVTGSSQADAKSALAQAGLLVTVQTQESSSVPEGNVISQDRSAGSKVAKGSTVTITVATAPAPTPTVAPTTAPTSAPASTASASSNPTSTKPGNGPPPKSP